MSYATFMKNMESQRGGNYSKSSLVDLSAAMINEPDCVVTVYTKKGDTYAATEMTPGLDVRNHVIAPALKSFGVDKAELPKLATLQISRTGAEALANFGVLLVKEYISLKGMGRKLTLPMTSLEDTAATIGMQEVPEKVENTNKIVKDGKDYVVQPTGKEVTTKKHDKLVGKNKCQPWQKSSKDIA